MSKFLADVMLGSLAKWLRILGYDTAYDNRVEDDELIERSASEQRIILTRDTGLVRRIELQNCLFIKHNELEKQICEVLDFLGERLDGSRLLTRCVQCNTRLQEIAKESIESGVPPYVYRTQSRFKRCPNCLRVYWSGTHREHILQRLKDMGVSGLD